MHHLRSRVSIEVDNATQDPLTRTVSVSSTVSYSANISITIPIRSAISAVLGGSWTNSYQLSDSVGITVQPGYKSWFEFTPIMDNSYGVTEYYNSFGSKVSSVWTDIYTARRVSGQADGILTAVTVRR
ncbi:hypothetical protein [Paenibacillus senegalensis]|uniref:hypothetical protein n=1 Tax=Paenibacillus senegalensis TaxID=1465766 RepID=UPI00138AD952|nr:hypothetical protein [Paenibacillus senegalensis]